MSAFSRPNRAASLPAQFSTRTSTPSANWWLIKQFFKNPYACVRVIFLDKKLIRKLGKVAKGDEDWEKYWRYIRHIPGHRNHMHLRIGDGPGQPGCAGGGNPEDEPEEIEGVEESVDLEALDLQLHGAQAGVDFHSGSSSNQSPASKATSFSSGTSLRAARTSADHGLVVRQALPARALAVAS